MTTMTMTSKPAAHAQPLMRFLPSDEEDLITARKNIVEDAPYYTSRWASIQIKALCLSIEHWLDNWWLAKQGCVSAISMGVGACACCKYYYSQGHCGNCPVREVTKQPMCGNSPYNLAYSLLHELDREVNPSCVAELQSTIWDEYVFLVEVLLYGKWNSAEEKYITEEEEEPNEDDSDGFPFYDPTRN